MNDHHEGTLEIAVREMTGAHVIEVSGDFVITKRDEAGRMIEKILDSGGHTIVVDGARLTHIDTPSLALLVRLAARCRAAGGGLALVALPARFTPLAKALRLTEAFVLEDSIDRAIDRLRA